MLKFEITLEEANLIVSALDSSALPHNLVVQLVRKLNEQAVPQLEQDASKGKESEIKEEDKPKKGKK